MGIKDDIWEKPIERLMKNVQTTNLSQQMRPERNAVGETADHACSTQ